MHNISVKCQSNWHWYIWLTFFEKDSNDDFQFNSKEMHLVVKTEECKQIGKKNVT